MVYVNLTLHTMEHYNPVGWFEIPVEDLDRAEAFYQHVLTIELSRQPEQNGTTMSWFPMHMDAMGAAGSLVKSNDYNVQKEGVGVVVYFTAPDLEEAIERARTSGGTVIVEKKDIGEHGFFAWVRDTEGNTIALHRNRHDGE
jgi:predicted enzyme related to lactoylglutathione lyase